MDLTRDQAGQYTAVYLVDAVDGYTPEVGIVIADLTVWVAKEGAQEEAVVMTADKWVEIANGVYWFMYDEDDVDTLGRLLLHIVAAGCRNFVKEEDVVAARGGNVGGPTINMRGGDDADSADGGVS
jgi:hypothetical protein